MTCKLVLNHFCDKDRVQDDLNLLFDPENSIQGEFETQKKQRGKVYSQTSKLDDGDNSSLSDNTGNKSTHSEMAQEENLGKSQKTTSFNNNKTYTGRGKQAKSTAGAYKAQKQSLNKKILAKKDKKILKKEVKLPLKQS